MFVIGLNGRKGSGKDTVGAYLVGKYGFTRKAYADLLKTSAAAAISVPASLLELYKNDPDARITLSVPAAGVTGAPSGRFPALEGARTILKSITVREYLQYYGDEAHRRVFGQDFWRNAVFAQLNDPEGRYAFTDARYNDELRALRDFGGRVWRIERPGTDVGDEHASEADPDPALVDCTIDNSGTLEDLYAAVDKAIALNS